MKRGWTLAAALLSLAFFASAGSASFAQEPVSGYTQVQRAFLKEDFSQVIALAQDFILQNSAAPEVPRVWLWLVLSLDRLQQSSEALRELNRLKDRLPTEDSLWPEILYWEGDISRRAFNVVRAKMSFQRLLERFPESNWAQQAQLGIGLIDLHQQDFESALANFKQVAGRETDSPAGRDARLFEGLCELQLKHFKEAETVLAPLLKEIKQPATIAQTAFYLGEALSGQGRFEDAVKAYQQAVSVKAAAQWAAPAQFALGWAYYRLDDCRESVKFFDQFLKTGTVQHQTDAWFAEGSCLLRLGKESEALPLFERVFIRDRENPLAAESGMIMADAYRKEGKSTQAFDLLQRLLDRPLEASAKSQVDLRLAALHLEEGRSDQARALYTQLRRSSDHNVAIAALSGLGDVQLSAGETSAARASYEEVIRELPQSTPARYATYQLGRIATQQGNQEDAVATFKRLIATAEPDIAEDARVALALTYLSQGQEALAASTLQDMRKDQRGSVGAARAAYYLALIAAGNGDSAQARKLCQETIEKASRAEEAANARLLIADLIGQKTSRHEAARWLRQQFQQAGLPPRQRGKLAKRLGDLARDEQHYAEAVLWYDDAAQLVAALRTEMVYRIATCYEEAGDVEVAMHWYRQIQQAPWQVRGQLALAKLLEREERIEEACKVYEQLSKQDIAESKLAQERLEALRHGLIRRSPAG